MSNEERILSMLEALTKGQAETNARLDKLESKVDKLESAQTELKTEIHKRFDTIDADLKKVSDFAIDAEEANEKRHIEIFERLQDITSVTKDNMYDIALLKQKTMWMPTPTASVSPPKLSSQVNSAADQ